MESVVDGLDVVVVEVVEVVVELVVEAVVVLYFQSDEGVAERSRSHGGLGFAVVVLEGTGLQV